MSLAGSLCFTAPTAGARTAPRPIASLVVSAPSDGAIMIGADAEGHNDLMSRIAAFLAKNEQ